MPMPNKVGVDTPAFGREGSELGEAVFVATFAVAVAVGFGVAVVQTQSVSVEQDGLRQKPW